LVSRAFSVWGCCNGVSKKPAIRDAVYATNIPVVRLQTHGIPTWDMRAAGWTETYYTIEDEKQRQTYQWRNRSVGKISFLRGCGIITRSPETWCRFVSINIIGNWRDLLHLLLLAIDGKGFTRSFFARFEFIPVTVNISQPVYTVAGLEESEAKTC